MRKFGVALVAFVAAGVLAVPAASTANPEPSNGGGNGHVSQCERQLNETVAKFDEAFLGRQLDKFVGYYHKDATTIGQTGNIGTGATIRNNFAGLFATDFVANFHIVRQVVHNCQTAEVISDFVLDIPSANYHDHFVNGLTWVMDHGRWKVMLDQNSRFPAGT
jgi:ketosteroid isomerase-like protein